MYTTEWTPGTIGSKTYFECLASIKSDLTPIFKLRDVKMTDNDYLASVKDYFTDLLLASKMDKTHNIRQQIIFNILSQENIKTLLIQIIELLENNN